MQVTLNSDCPLFVESSATEEYRIAQDLLGLDGATLAAIARTSLTVSSCPDDRRTTALAALDVWISPPPPGDAD